jgi:hypothetical protein
MILCSHFHGFLQRFPASTGVKRGGIRTLGAIARVGNACPSSLNQKKSGKIGTPRTFLFDICDFPSKIGGLMRFSSKKRSLFVEPPWGFPGGWIPGMSG